MRYLEFTAIPIEINGTHLVRLPEEISKVLPSRGMVMGKITCNASSFIAALEPDGNFGHWFALSDKMTLVSKAQDCKTWTLELITQWPAPDIPDDLKKALQIHSLEDDWTQLTNKAKWAWIRWIRFTNNPATRTKRIDTACSMLSSGKKRPCCFDHSRCTVSAVAKSGVLIDLEARHHS